MLLITGGTGFIGSILVKRLLKNRFDTRLLVQPQKRTPTLPKNVPLDIAVSSLQDLRGLRAALKEVDLVIHLATAEHKGPTANLEEVDVEGTQNLIESCLDAGVKKIIFLSRVGADKFSTYPVIKAKGLAEDMIEKSGLSFTIVRLTEVFGKRDHFISDFSKAIHYAPLVMPYPSGGKIALQPIWVNDVIACLMLILEEEPYDNRLIEIGGSEYYPIRKVLEIIKEKMRKRRLLFPIAPAYLRLINLWFKPYKGAFPLPSTWIDLLAMDRTCPLDSMSKYFRILPARFDHQLDFL
jgi:nucleoside-diphosphate-sugar epimerase